MQFVHPGPERSWRRRRRKGKKGKKNKKGKSPKESKSPKGPKGKVAALKAGQSQAAELEVGAGVALAGMVGLVALVATKLGPFVAAEDEAALLVAVYSVLINVRVLSPIFSSDPCTTMYYMRCFKKYNRAVGWIIASPPTSPPDHGVMTVLPTANLQLKDGGPVGILNNKRS